MKRLFTSFLMAMTAILTITAQNGLRFVDAQGNEIKDGSTIYMTKVEEDFFGDKMVVLEGVYVENTTSKDVEVYMDANIVSLPSGSFQCCLGSQCKALESGTIKIEKVSLAANSKIVVDKTEWMVGTSTSGVATVTLQLGTAGKIDGSKITVKFLLGDDASAIRNTNSSNKIVAAYYSVDGKQISKAVKGLNLVRYTDGTVKKIFK